MDLAFQIGMNLLDGDPCTNWNDISWGQVLVAGIMGALLNGIRVGPELKIGKNARIAPFGNRTGHPTGRWPHYHRRVPNPAKPGQGMPGQGIGRHRPWDRMSTDRSWWDRF